MGYMLYYKSPTSNKYESIIRHADRDDHKYIAKVPVGRGRYRYFYTKEEYDSYKSNLATTRSNTPNVSNVSNTAKDTVNTTSENTKNAEVKDVETNIFTTIKNTFYNKDGSKKDPETVVEDVLNKAVDKANDVYGKLVRDNMYVTNSSNYEKKRKQIEQTDEWKQIVATNDPEYVKINKDGTKEYLFDKYLVNKKHQELDILADLAEGRKISINEVTKETVVANIVDTINTGIAVVGIVGLALAEKIKVSQGSYKDEIDYIKNSPDRVKKNGEYFVLELQAQYDRIRGR